jgi:hypothetical protein
VYMQGHLVFFHLIPFHPAPFTFLFIGRVI